MGAIEPTLSLGGDRRVRRRRIVNRAAEAVALVAALAAVVVLAIVVLSVARRGASQLSWTFLTGDLPLFGIPGGGIAPLIVGSAILVGIATAIALPLGVFTALFLSEFASRRVAAPIQLTLDLMNGLPSIIIGVFIFGLLVQGHAQSGYAGGCALSIVMLPLIARSAQEVLRLVPVAQREGAQALGASRWRTVIGVVLPSALGGILTGTVLAIARAAGETAPLLFACSIYANSVTTNPHDALPNIPVQIFIWSESADPADHERAWASALVLLLFVLATSLLARAALARTRKKLGQ
ncbi:MAG TPA: phosphate ABC transporter permease PstA [Gaiellaceae bacterium]|jgi:phosphate transport system permease protein|nr:phosphate ABC transporter permease PstA [Gaiellaceae bacterium]